MISDIYFFFVFFFFILAAIAGSVIAGGSLGVDVLKSVLQSLGDINRKIAIGVWNKTDHPWEPISVYFSSGTSETNLPHDVPQGTK